MIDAPYLTFDTSTPPPAAQECLVQKLQATRLGFNLTKLHPSSQEAAGAYVVFIGPGIRLTVVPKDSGSEVRLFASAWGSKLSDVVAACKV